METKINKDHNLLFTVSLINNEKLSAIDKIILSVIATYDGEKGCYLSNAVLGIFESCSEGTVSKSIKKMYPKYIIYNEPSTEYGGRRFVRKVNPAYKRKTSDIHEKELPLKPSKPQG